MDAALLLAVVRALHFASVVVLFGQFAYTWLVAPTRAAPPGFGRTAVCSAAILIVTGIGWLALEAMSMSGLPAAEALSAPTLGIVATRTFFGRVWLCRMVLATALLLALVMARRTDGSRAGFNFAGAASALLLVSLACSGHAAGGKGAEGAVHLCVDGLHLLAAAAWLGALLPLIAILGHASLADEAHRRSATQRFSTLGIAAVCVILLSGIANAAYTVADFSTIFDSRYGELLVAKVALFAVIVGIAAVNRVVLMPRLDLRALRRNAIAECALGFCIVAIVGELGITIPAAHHH